MKKIIEDYLRNLIDFVKKLKNKTSNIKELESRGITKRLIKEVLIES